MVFAHVIKVSPRDPRFHAAGRRFHSRNRNRRRVHLRRKVPRRELSASPHRTWLAVDGQRRTQHQRERERVCVFLFFLKNCEGIAIFHHHGHHRLAERKTHCIWTRHRVMMSECRFYVLIFFSFCRGMDVVKKIESHGSPSGQPSRSIVITNSGQI